MPSEQVLDRAAHVARMALGALLDPSGATTAITGVDALRDLFRSSSNPDEFARIEARVAAGFRNFAAAERIAPEELERIVGELGEVVRSTAAGIRAFAELNFDVAACTRHLLSARSRDPLLERLTETYLAALFADPVAFVRLAPQVSQVSLQRLTALDRSLQTLPAAVVRALHARAAELAFEPLSLPRTTFSRDAELLRAENQVAPFVPRPTLDELMDAMLDAAHLFDARLLVAPGGMGKTRWLRRYCAHAAGRCWAGGLVRAGRLDEGNVQRALIECTAPLLLAFDYADGRTRDLRLARDLWQDRVARRLKTRVVLLARSAGLWWPELAKQRFAQDAAPGYETPVELAALADASEPTRRLALFHAAREAFAAVIDRPGSGLDAAAAAPGEPPDLADPLFDRTLYVHMAALASLRGARLTSAEALLDWALERERRAWQTVLVADEWPTLDAPLAQASAAISLLGGVAARDPLREVLDKLPAVRDAPHELAPLLAALNTLYGDERTHARGVEPDLLAEWLVARVLDREPSLLHAVVSTATDAELAATLQLLTRLGRNHAAERRWAKAVFETDFQRLLAGIRAAPETLGVAVTAAALELSLDLDAISALHDALPHTSFALAENAHLVTALLYADARRRQAAGHDEAPAEVALCANNLAVRLAALGRREEALAACGEAIGLYRELAAVRPDAFRDYLAASLNNLSNCLTAVGRREDALAACDEAVNLNRDLAAARPDAFRSHHLASSLNNRSNCLAALGRREEALAASNEAIAIHRDLATARPDAFRPGLAGSLDNLARCLAALGRREDALAVCDEAVGVYRDLAAAQPDAFRHYLAGSLNNHSVYLAALGRHKEALAVCDEAVSLKRALATARPDAFHHDLAGSLTNRSGQLAALGRPEEALAASNEAIAIHRDLAASRPDAFRPDLAGSLDTLAGCLAGLGRREEALAACDEAVGLYRYLAAARPDAFRADLASSLNNLSGCLAGLGRRAEALAACDEAIAIRRDLAAVQPDAFRPDLAMSLWTRGKLIGACGDAGGASASFAEGLGLVLPLAEGIPTALGPLVENLLGGYVREAQAAGIKPAEPLLGRAVKVLRAADLRGGTAEAGG